MSPVAHRYRESALPTPTECPRWEQGRVQLERHAASEAIFLDITRTFGISFVPDLFEAMRSRPAYLEAAWELFKDDLRLDDLDRKTKQIIALAITTDEAGTYYIAAYPHAFRLQVLDRAMWHKIVSTIRFFKAFDRYLSGVVPTDATETTKFVRRCLHDECQSYEATTSGERMPSREENRLIVFLIGGMLIMSLLFVPIAVGAYLLLQ